MTFVPAGAAPGGAAMLRVRCPHREAQMKVSNKNLKKSQMIRPLCEAVEDRTMFNTYTVTTTADSGTGSFRAAIQAANSHSGADTINFKITSGDAVITPTTQLPQLTDQVTIDASTQSGYLNKPVVRIDGSKCGGYGLAIRGGNSTVKALDITTFSTGILIMGGNNNTVKGCQIGIDRGGSLHGNTDKGIIVQSAGNTIGGTAALDRNIISGNKNAGIQLYTSAAKNNTIIGNYIGTNISGTGAIQNGSGVVINGGSYNTIGGTSSGSRNLISGNNGDGVVMNNSGSTNNTVIGNYIGTDVTGTKALANTMYGVEISQGYNRVGGTTAGERNVISGNGNSGVVLWLSSGSHNTVSGNYIGTNAAGSAKIPNVWSGIEVSSGSSYNTIGGSTSGAGNVISGNTEQGVKIYQGSNNGIIGNTIGWSADRKIALGNGHDGIQFVYCSSSFATNNYIGNNGASGIANLGGSNTESSNTIINDTLYNLK